MWIQFPWLMLQSCEPPSGSSAAVVPVPTGTLKKSSQPYWGRKKLGDEPIAVGATTVSRHLCCVTVCTKCAVNLVR